MSDTPLDLSPEARAQKYAMQQWKLCGMPESYDTVLQNAASDYLAGYHSRDAELAALRASIPEWLCEKCRTIHPPPKLSNICCPTPGCDGVLHPSTLIERRLREQVARYRLLLERAKIYTEAWIDTIEDDAAAAPLVSLNKEIDAAIAQGTPEG